MNSETRREAGAKTGDRAAASRDNGKRGGRRKASDAQADRILGLLQESAGEWVSLKAILSLGIAQYNTRIRELRGRGHAIENR